MRKYAGTVILEKIGGYMRNMVDAKNAVQG